MLSCEFCEISKNNVFHRTHLVATSVRKVFRTAAKIYITTFYKNARFFYKQHFDTLISNARLKLVKKQAKAKNTLKLNFCYLKIIRFFHPRCHPKIIADILKKVPKTSASMSISMRLYN